MRYDQIISVDGIKIDTDKELNEILKNKKVGDTVILTINRAGTVSDYEIVLMSRNGISSSIT